MIHDFHQIVSQNHKKYALIIYRGKLTKIALTIFSRIVIVCYEFIPWITMQEFIGQIFDDKINLSLVERLIIHVLFKLKFYCLLKF
jgi:hypothetical protein